MCRDRERADMTDRRDTNRWRGHWSGQVGMRFAGAGQAFGRDEEKTRHEAGFFPFTQ